MHTRIIFIWLRQNRITESAAAVSLGKTVLGQCSNFRAKLAAIHAITFQLSELNLSLSKLQPYHFRKPALNKSPGICSNKTGNSLESPRNTHHDGQAVPSEPNTVERAQYMLGNQINQQACSLRKSLAYHYLLVSSLYRRVIYQFIN